MINKPSSSQRRHYKLIKEDSGVIDVENTTQPEEKKEDTTEQNEENELTYNQEDQKFETDNSDILEFDDLDFNDDLDLNSSDDSNFEHTKSIELLMSIQEPLDIAYKELKKNQNQHADQVAILRDRVFNLIGLLKNS